MIRFRPVLARTAIFLALLALPAAGAGAAATTDIKDAASGAYRLDAGHASITFKINHLGFSRYTGRFDKMEGTLDFDNQAPEKSALDVTVHTDSIDTNHAKLEEELRGEKWFDAAKFPFATFRSTKITRTGPATGKVTGDFTLHGVTRALTLDVTLIGTGSHPMNGKPIIGFSATGSFNRADFGIQNFIPLVGDEVTLEIEAEFDKAE